MTGFETPALHDANEPVVAGTALDHATHALVLVHGRGGSAAGMLPIARAAKATGAALIAPVATNGSWYPDRFLAPRAHNEPWLSSALAAVGRAVELVEASGIPRERLVLVGFSQGACLTLDWIASQAANGTRFGGVAALAGALIGSDDELTAHRLTGSLRDTPVLIACGTADAHIPEPRVRDTAAAFSRLGAAVDLQLYAGVGHDIVGDEITRLAALVAGVA